MMTAPSTPAFSAIYLLLFISLVGCLTPRIWEHAKALRTPPVNAPRNLKRMPRHITETVDGEPAELAERIEGLLARADAGRTPWPVEGDRE